MSKIPVYFMPGLAASATIFENINLSNDIFEVYLLDWVLPLENESLKSYAERMSQKVIHKNAVLIGVSFGGILVQEMAQFLDLKKVIIISSVKSNAELPKKMKFAKMTKAYKLLPTSLLSDMDQLAKYLLGAIPQQRIDYYKKYLTITDKKYLDWAIEQVIVWDRLLPDNKVIHIHGDHDTVFPCQNINNFINVKNGTHVMILNRSKWFNENLPKIILE
jgi:pimeloyl-ACP methyl ester carboxylesterase